MFHRFILKFVLAVIIMLALAMPALAGCCVVITLDEFPMQVIAEQSLHVGFMMRFAHMPMGGRTPQITAIRADTHESFSVTAEAQGDAGHYTARLTFPSAGTWNWSIDAVGGFDQPMPTLTVLASAPSSSVNAGVAFSFPLAVGILGLIGAAGALLVSLRRRARWAVALVLAGAVISGAGFASEANSTAVAASQIRWNSARPCLSPKAASCAISTTPSPSLKKVFTLSRLAQT